jgi:hypothetical protein
MTDEPQVPSLSDLVKDAIINADCFCKPGDPTCADWLSAEHRWDAIHTAVMRVIEQTVDHESSNLVEHARIEYELIGEDQDYVDGILKVIQAFSDMGHSGGSASIAIPQINLLLQFKNLTPLTNHPSEWMFVSEDIWGAPGGIWQNKRNSEAFSNNGGETYYLLSEGGNDRNRKPLHTAETRHE